MIIQVEILKLSLIICVTFILCVGFLQENEMVYINQQVFFWYDGTYFGKKNRKKGGTGINLKIKMEVTVIVSQNQLKKYRR